MPRIDASPTFRTSLNAFLLLLILLSACVCSGQNETANESTMVYGTWILKSIYPTQNVEGPSPAQQKKLLGTTIVLNARTLKACGQSVPVKSIKVNQVSSTDFLEDNRVRFSELGVEGASITEIVINHRQSGTCFDAFPLPGQDIYIKNKNEILVYFEGVFYRALRKH
ncbi:MAG: hypothetical protein ACYC93_06805 [Candidatus Acidiferrales bacterium]